MCCLSVAQDSERSLEAYFEARQELNQVQGTELSLIISLSLGVMGLLI